MRRGLAGQNVSQRAPRVVLECVVLCVVVYDTSDTFCETRPERSVEVFRVEILHSSPLTDVNDR